MDKIQERENIHTSSSNANKLQKEKRKQKISMYKKTIGKKDSIPSLWNRETSTNDKSIIADQSHPQKIPKK